MSGRKTSRKNEQLLVPYSHAIVCCYCVVRKFSPTGSAVRTVYIGTLIEIHDIQKDNVLFCIVKNNTPDSDLFLCKKTDLLFVPENLWGPLLAVQQDKRLPLVQCEELAESLGNLTVGSPVKVLGDDRKEVCFGTITFKNTITKLGAGIYFGLKIKCPEKNIQFIKENFSLLEPGTKGFPRGCDIVVTADKIIPLSYENSFGLEDPNYSANNDGNIACESKSDSKDKDGSNLKSSQYGNAFDMSLEKWKNKGTSFPLSSGEKVVFLHGDKAEIGTVKWFGYIKNSMKVGVEFDNPIGSGTGTVEGVEFFRTKYLHAGFFPPESLIKLSDFYKDALEDFDYQPSSSNNDSLTDSKAKDSTQWSWTHDFGTAKPVQKNKYKYLQYPHSFQRTSYLYGNSFENDLAGGWEYCSSYTTECSACSSFTERLTNYREMMKAREGKSFSTEQSDLNDNDLLREKQFIRNSTGQTVSGGPSPNMEFFEDFTQDRKGRSRSVENDTYNRDFNFGDFNYARRANQSGSSQYEKKTDPANKVSFTLLSPAKKFKNSFVHLSHGQRRKLRQISVDSVIKMNNNIYDQSYIPVTVLEYSKNCREKSNSPNKYGENFYDVPSSAVSSSFDVNENCNISYYSRKIVPEFDVRDIYGRDFYSGRRHTLAYNHYVQGLHEYPYAPRGSLIPVSSADGANYQYKTPVPNANNFSPENLGKGSAVQFFYKGQSYFGVIRWIGTIANDREPRPRLMAGIEVEEESPYFTDGTFLNQRYFKCDPHKALFIPLSECRKDPRFLEQKKPLGELNCPVIKGAVPPINQKNHVERICGKNRGIQGHHNSCYLDATLFSMFAFTCVFDSLLFRPPNLGDIPQYLEVQRVLKEEIVNPLRKNLYVGADRVMKLRTWLENLSSVSGLTSEEKDPEEFLQSLLAQILKADPFLKLNSGQETYFYQLFIDRDKGLTFPSVQQLFEQSFFGSDLKLKEIPSCLILQMPRFGKLFRMYPRIYPPKILDITDVLDNSPRQCTVCGKLAEYECRDCFGQSGIGNGLESISFCEKCLYTAHNHHLRMSHKQRRITVPFEFYDLQEHCTIPRVHLELFAVLCIETSHYVAFAKCGTGVNAPWCFFDSMADRQGEQNGYNIPEIVPCPDLPYWLSEEGVKALSEVKDDRQLPELAKRLLCDAYICMYQSESVMMYR